jgi:hypothetical protein
MLVGKHHLFAAVASLKSFFLTSALAPQVGLTFHLDATMRPRHERFLARHFPGAATVPFGASNARLQSIINKRPFCREFSHGHVFAPKLLKVPAFCRAERVILLDSDTFFYLPPSAIIRWVTGASDAPTYLDAGLVPHAPLYRAYEELSGYLGADCRKFCYFNAGLLLFRPARVDFDLVERFLEYQAKWPNVHIGGWCLEQAAYMVNYASWPGALALGPPDYTCGVVPGRVFAHFLGSNYYLPPTLIHLRAQLAKIREGRKDADGAPAPYRPAPGAARPAAEERA